MSTNTTATSPVAYPPLTPEARDAILLAFATFTPRATR